MSRARRCRRRWSGRTNRSSTKTGAARMTLKLDKDDFRAAQDLMVTAEVQDETHQTIAANVAIPAHPAAVYFGIDRGSPIGGSGGARTIKVVAVDPEGGANRGERDAAGPEARLELRLGGLGLPRQLPLREEGAGGDAAGDRHRPAGAPAEVRFVAALVGRVLPDRRGDATARGTAPPAPPSCGPGATARPPGRPRTTSGSTSSPTSPSTRSATPPSLLLKTSVRDAAGPPHRSSATA